jgi:group I intron endonuclease
MQYTGMARIKSGRAFLYCISNNLNGKNYIGIASDPEERWRKHKGSLGNKRIRQSIHRAMLKYGADAFTFSVLATSPTWADGLATERALITQYDTKRNGYNSTDGGEGMHGLVHSAATRELLGSLSRGRKASEETRKKLSQARARRVIILSAESRAKISATLTGRKLPPITDAHRAALSASQKGRKRGPLTAEHRALLSKIRTGKKRPPMSDEWRANIAAAQRGKKRGPPSPETRMKSRASMLAYFQRKAAAADADIAPGES